jgi:anti-sigma B factor antagonist
MTAKINIRHSDSVTILDVTGRITLGEGGVTLRDAVQQAIGEEQGLPIEVASFDQKA